VQLIFRSDVGINLQDREAATTGRKVLGRIDEGEERVGEGGAVTRPSSRGQSACEKWREGGRAKDLLRLEVSEFDRLGRGGGGSVGRLAVVRNERFGCILLCFGGAEGGTRSDGQLGSRARGGEGEERGTHARAWKGEIIVRVMYCKGRERRSLSAVVRNTVSPSQSQSTESVSFSSDPTTLLVSLHLWTRLRRTRGSRTRKRRRKLTEDGSL
jgi:hypothetical protein